MVLVVSVVCVLWRAAPRSLRPVLGKVHRDVEGGVRLRIWRWELVLG